MRHPACPIYVVDTDSLVFQFADLAGARGYIEVSDVLAGEYVGWDAEGCELQFGLRGDEVIIQRASKAEVDLRSTVERVREGLVRRGWGKEVKGWPSDPMRVLVLASDPKYEASKGPGQG